MKKLFVLAALASSLLLAQSTTPDTPKQEKGKAKQAKDKGNTKGKQAKGKKGKTKTDDSTTTK